MGIGQSTQTRFVRTRVNDHRLKHLSFKRNYYNNTSRVIYRYEIQSLYTYRANKRRRSEASCLLQSSGYVLIIVQSLIVETRKLIFYFSHFCFLILKFCKIFNFNIFIENKTMQWCTRSVIIQCHLSLLNNHDQHCRFRRDRLKTILYGTYFVDAVNT